MREPRSSIRTLAPWTNVYGVARSLLAIATLSSLVVDGYDRLFRPLGQELANPHLPLSARISIFLLLSGEWLWLAHLIAVAALFVVAIGWKPRFTGIFHWWIAHSFATSCLLVEGAIKRQPSWLSCSCRSR